MAWRQRVPSILSIPPLCGPAYVQAGGGGAGVNAEVVRVCVRLCVEYEVVFVCLTVKRAAHQSGTRYPPPLLSLLGLVHPPTTTTVVSAAV